MKSFLLAAVAVAIFALPVMAQDYRGGANSPYGGNTAPPLITEPSPKFDIYPSTSETEDKGVVSFSDNPKIHVNVEPTGQLTTEEFDGLIQGRDGR
jgi:opacity protein-like surface antigen